MAASTTINSYFRSRINQFHSNTLQRLWRSNPFRSLVPTREYNGADGEGFEEKNPRSAPGFGRDVECEVLQTLRVVEGPHPW